MNALRLDHPVFPEQTIPACELTLSEVLGEKMIFAFVSTDAEMFKVYTTLFLDRVANNQESRFVCVRPPHFKPEYVEWMSAERTEAPLDPKQRVVCIYPPKKEEASPQNASGREPYSMESSLACVNSENPRSRSDSLGMGLYTISEAEDTLNNDCVLHTTRMGFDRITYRVTMTPKNGCSLFSSAATLDVLHVLGRKKYDAMGEQIFPPEPPPADAEEATWRALTNRMMSPTNRRASSDCTIS
ncbi:MAG TPA: hypothetical protein VJK48_05100 [Chlamydiales bacterium]|nr:MAG: hypothetical protein A3F67_03770 [Verrucomicrobia bacterium RIFCSPHIGHO2_12_FULL_41_10]HLB53068.1 hypothetical protein [Chlamydiales bacterium]